MSNFKTLSAILRSPWLINQEYAIGLLPWISGLLTGSPAAAIPRSGAAEYEQPFFIDPTKMQRYSWYLRGEIVIPPWGSVAVVPVNGPITKYNGECGEPGSVYRQSLVMEIDNRPEIAGALYLYDTPGGQVSGTSSLATSIRTAKKKSVGYVDDGMAASAGMWFLSASAEAYVSQNLDRVGSIGAYMTLPDFTGYLEKLGIKLHEIYAPQSTDKNGTYHEAITGNYEPVKEELSYVVDSFIQFVANRSSTANANKAKWSTGKMFYADEAKKIGLIDGVLPIEKAIQRVVALNSSSGKILFSSTKSNTMSFEKTLAAAKTESFTVVEGGFLLSESDLNNLEANLSQGETAATQSAAANKAFSDQSAKDTTRITELQLQIDTMKKANAGSFTAPSVEGEDAANDSKNKFVTSYDLAVAHLKLK
jgi:protease-4